MNRPAELECARRLPPLIPSVPLAHLLACEECAERLAREADPSLRRDLFPGGECFDDEELAQLARDRGGSPDPEHLRQCLWCALSVRHFESQPVPFFATRPLPTFPTAKKDRRLPPSAEIHWRGNSLTVRSPLARKPRRFSLSPSLPVRKLIPDLVTRQQLPLTAPDGSPMTYFLEWREGGRRLDGDESLLQAGVKEGDHVYLAVDIAPKEEPSRVTGIERSRSNCG